MDTVTIQKGFRPMLAEDHTPARLASLLQETAVWTSCKLDGVRALVIKGQVLSRSLKPIPNKHVQKVLGRPEFEGFDGELIVGDPYGPSVFQRTISGVMTEEGTPDVKLYVVDYILNRIIQKPFEERLNALRAYMYVELNHRELQHVVLLHQSLACSQTQVIDFEESALEAGYEGLILKHPRAPYKFGRSTLKQGWMLKVKRFADAEAAIIGFVELERNNNEAVVDALGLQKRSSVKANKVGGGVLGALKVRDSKHGWEFEIGTGFDANLRETIWQNQGKYLGQYVKYKYLPIGMLDKPRHPVFLGFRPADDFQS